MMSEFVGGMLYGGLLGGALYSSQLSFRFQVSKNTNIGPVHHDIVANGIVSPWL